MRDGNCVRPSVDTETSRHYASANATHRLNWTVKPGFGQIGAGSVERRRLCCKRAVHELYFANRLYVYEGTFYRWGASQAHYEACIFATRFGLGIRLDLVTRLQIRAQQVQ